MKGKRVIRDLYNFIITHCILHIMIHLRHFFAVMLVHQKTHKGRKAILVQWCSFQSNTKTFALWESLESYSYCSNYANDNVIDVKLNLLKCTLNEE